MANYKNGIIPGRPLKSWQGNITQDEAVVAKIRNLFPARTMATPNVLRKITKDAPPVYIYLEIPDEDGYTIEDFYSNPGHLDLRAQRGFSINRELLSTETKYIDDNFRGKILSAFCEIEFLIDVMVCLGKGVYRGSETYKKVRQLYTYSCTKKNRLPDTEARINFLLENMLIADETYRYLKMAKKVRNTLAHQFMPSHTVGLTDTELKPYKHVGEAVFSIYNTAWFLLLKDYVPQQEAVIDWLQKVDDEGVNEE